MGIEITGEIHVIGDTKQVSERFTKQGDPDLDIPF
jgi:hypothetical protein